MKVTLCGLVYLGLALSSVSAEDTENGETLICEVKNREFNYAIHLQVRYAKPRNILSSIYVHRYQDEDYNSGIAFESKPLKLKIGRKSLKVRKSLTPEDGPKGKMIFNASIREIWTDEHTIILKGSILDEKFPKPIKFKNLECLAAEI